MCGEDCVANCHLGGDREYCSMLQLPDCLTEQAGGEVGWANVWKTQRGAVPSLTNIYSLAQPLYLPETKKNSSAVTLLLFGAVLTYSFTRCQHTQHF